MNYSLKIEDQDTFYYTIGPEPNPVLTVEPGSTIEIETIDAFEEEIDSESTKPSDVMDKTYRNPTMGPIAVEGAEKGDALGVKIEKIEPRGENPEGTTCLVPNFGGLTPTTEHPTLNDPLPEIVKRVPLSTDGIKWSEDITLPYEPFIGTIGTSPTIQSITNITPDWWGGNMDLPDVCPGNTLYLPVSIEGGYLYLGDCHAVQGDGEVSGAAIEMSAVVTLTVDIVKDWTLKWPRLENEDIIMSIGSRRPLDDATRIAYYDLISWLMEKEPDFDKYEAYLLLGQLGKVRVGNIVDPNYTVGAYIEKKYLPNS